MQNSDVVMTYEALNDQLCFSEMETCEEPLLRYKRNECLILISTRKMAFLRRVGGMIPVLRVSASEILSSRKVVIAVSGIWSQFMWIRSGATLNLILSSLLVSGFFAGEIAKAATSPLPCDYEINRKDGKGGFKNNPANKRRTLKIIYPKQMSGKISDVKAYSAEELFDSFQLGGSEWGGRERYYGGKPVEVYPPDLRVVATLKDGRRFCVTLPKPQEVYD